MQKIVIKNFGSIEYAEIEIKKVLVLIGEQASGKSTIAKLIYFFKSLKDDLFSQIYQDRKYDYLDVPSDFIFPTREKFYDFFGSTFHLPNFEIFFYYSVAKNKYLKLTLDGRKKLTAHFNDNLLNENFRYEIGKIKKFFQESEKLNTNDVYKQLARQQDKLQYLQNLSTLLNDLFECDQTDLLFVIAGRNATVSYSELFDKYMFASIQSSLEENSKIKEDSKKFIRKRQAIDETLMLKFIERSGAIKDKFKKFKGFDGLIKSYPKNEIYKPYLKKIEDKINTILRGKYVIDTWSEKIVFNSKTKEYVHLHNASSGQQESIRILQDIFLGVLESSALLRIIEEPEAHLFPVAQKHLIELLAIMVNHNEDNQLIITTHSPYVLSVFNNLLFARRVVEKNPSAKSEVMEIISEDSWLNADGFSAYSLGNQSFGDEDVNYCESIFDTETGTIAQNYLDTVSEMLGGEFNKLYRIHARSFTRR